MKTKLFRSLAFAGLCISALVAPRLSAAGPEAGFYRVENRAGIWWLIDPQGSPFFSVGINHIRYAPDPIKQSRRSLYGEAVAKTYPDRPAWAAATLARLRSWGFNTIGAWSDYELWGPDVPYTFILGIGARASGPGGRPVDVYSVGFEDTAREFAALACRPRREDHNLVGYFSDNELDWGYYAEGEASMLGMYLQRLPPETAGRQQAIAFLRDRYDNDIHKLNLSWGVQALDFAKLPVPAKSAGFKADADQFGEQVASRYFEVCARAIHQADPNHLYLGARFAATPSEGVLRGARFADVVSINIYGPDPRPMVDLVFRVTGRPVMVTEFSFCAADAGLGLKTPEGWSPPFVPDQRARGKAYLDFTARLAAIPAVVGYHWFQWADQPKEGRFDGENFNFGLVTINNDSYPDFIEAVKSQNFAVSEAHGKSRPQAGP